jgi:hypothetical protein
MEPTCTGRLSISCGVPQRREKRLGNGVKNLSGSADLPEWLVITTEDDAQWVSLSVYPEISILL